jgi:hypothetical protein
VEGRLRRLCERKPSGAIHVPQEIHNLWKNRGAGRDSLVEIFMQVGENKDHTVWTCFLYLGFEFPSQTHKFQDAFISKVKKTHRVLKRSANTKRRGWYNKDGMAKKLLWTPYSPQ